MTNYEINILKRNGDWKKINPDDLLLETEEKDNIENKETLNDDKSFLFNINQVNSIIVELENLENKKSILKGQLKTFEEQFQNKKNTTEDKLNTMTQEIEMLNKAIGIIKNLKNL